MVSNRRKPTTRQLRAMVDQERQAREQREADAAAAAAAAQSAALQAFDAMSPLQRLDFMRRALAEMEDDIAAEVRLMNADGTSWEQIGRVFDMTGEGARRRWGPRRRLHARPR